MSEPKPPAPDGKEPYEVLKGLKFPKEYGLYAVDLLVKDLQAAQLLYDNQKALGLKLRSTAGWIGPNSQQPTIAERLALANAIAERRRELADERERDRARVAANQGPGPKR
jgi:hypothetical protein